MEYTKSENFTLVLIAVMIIIIFSLAFIPLRYLKRETIRATTWPPTSTPYTRANPVITPDFTITPMAFIPRDWEETDPLYPLIQGGHWNFRKYKNEGYRQ